MRTGWLSTLALALVACGGQDDPDLVASDEPLATVGQADNGLNGKNLFEKQTFQGNGRTCTTCHSAITGALSPADAQSRYHFGTNDPLFRSIDSDDGVGNSYSRMLAHATMRVHIPLPAGWTSLDDPSATSVTLLRGVPTTNNVPSLDNVFMYDGRFVTLQQQALGAVNGHYEPGRQPTSCELDAIAQFERTSKFFSSNALRQYANGGPAPTLPLGHTASQKRGRLFFVPSPTGLCGHCHSGPMLNQTSEFLLAPVAPGSRFFTAFVSELNAAGNPSLSFSVAHGDGTSETVHSPDPGRALITGNPADVNNFRIPTLWGVKDTAPYFHDNSAATLEALVQHYSDYFQIIGVGALSAQQQTDIVAYIRLL
jgi:cytochrome c peroxidase